ncbi:MAG: DUF2752 domain-containing protein [Fimbriimonadaceae bacterium]
MLELGDDPAGDDGAMIKKRLTERVVLGVGLGVYLLVVATVGVPCLFHQLTHLHCPGCGATRATWALVRGDFGLAARQNAWFVFLILPWVASLGLAWLMRTSRSGEAIGVWSKRLTYATAYAAIGFFILRNVPLPVFDFLRPI